MSELPIKNFNIDYKYIVGRDNYSCQESSCGESLERLQIFFQKIDREMPEDESNLVVSCRKCSIKDNATFKKPLRDYSGRLIVITGPMFSQKSTTTKALYNKYKAFNKVVTPKPFVWVKPAIDSRVDGFTKTHDEEKIEALSIYTDRPDLQLEILSKYSILAFDEAQFYSNRILYVIHCLLKQGSIIIVNGLKLTARRNLFGVMHYLMAEADEIYSLKSVCNVCELVDYATRTKCFHSSNPSVSIGGTEQYYAVCPTCDGGMNEEKLLKKFIQRKEI